jgi:hypothetical protein
MSIALIANQSIRNNEVFYDPLYFDTGSGIAIALPLLIHARFAHS